MYYIFNSKVLEMISTDGFSLLLSGQLPTFLPSFSSACLPVWQTPWLEPFRLRVATPSKIAQGCAARFPKTLTALFMTEICDISYPIYDLNKNLIAFI